MVVGSALQGALTANLNLIEKAEARKEKNQQNLMTVLKCLSVLTDMELVKMAILPSSYLRKLADDFITKEHKYDVVMADVLSRFGDLVPKEPEAAIRMDTVEQGVNLHVEGVKLSKYLYETEDYIKSGALGVEQAVDKFLVRNEDLLEHNTDVGVLMSWLEVLIPAVDLDVRD